MSLYGMMRTGVSGIDFVILVIAGALTQPFSEAVNV